METVSEIFEKLKKEIGFKKDVRQVRKFLTELEDARADSEPKELEIVKIVFSFLEDITSLKEIPMKIKEQFFELLFALLPYYLKARVTMAKEELGKNPGNIYI